mgnify:CR=1 FL=1
MLGLPLFIFSVQIDLFGLYGGMPNLADVENPENDLSSEIISADGVSATVAVWRARHGAEGRREQEGVELVPRLSAEEI